MGSRHGPALREQVALVAALAGVRDNQVVVALGCPDLLARALGATDDAADGTADVVVCWEAADLDVVGRLLKPGGKAVVPAGTDTTGWAVRHSEEGWLVVHRTI